MSTNLKAINSYMNFFTVDEKDASEVVGVLILTKKKERLIGSNFTGNTDRGIFKTEIEDEQKLFYIFNKYFRSILDKEKSLHIIYAD